MYTVFLSIKIGMRHFFGITKKSWSYHFSKKDAETWYYICKMIIWDTLQFLQTYFCMLWNAILHYIWILVVRQSVFFRKPLLSKIAKLIYLFFVPFPLIDLYIKDENAVYGFPIVWYKKKIMVQKTTRKNQNQYLQNFKNSSKKV